MAIQTTTWKPDTCRCKINYVWDDAVPEKERTFSVGEGSVKCAVHSSHENDADLFAAVLEENTSKNIAIAQLIEAVPAFAIVDKEGNKTPDLSKISFSFDKERKIKIEMKDIKASDKLSAIAALTGKQGLSKVSIK